jgi:NuA3 HAT complex component NTO1
MLIRGKRTSKHVFTEWLLKLQAKVKARFYVTALDFAHDFCNIFRSVINSELVSHGDGVVSKEERSASAKKTKAHAKRILKAVQPFLEKAVQNDAEICGKAVDVQLKELEQLLNMDIQLDSVSVNAADVDMADLDVSNQSNDTSGIEENGNVVGSGDIEMHDVDAPGEEVDDGDVIVALTSAEAEDTINTDIREDRISKKGPSAQSNGKNAPTPPDTNGYASAPEDEQSLQPQPPTPPISNGHDHSNALTEGGKMWYLNKFDIEGTTVVQTEDPTSNFNEDMSDAGVDVMGVDVGGEVATATVTASPTKAKKGKAKKKARGKR